MTTKLKVAGLDVDVFLKVATLLVAGAMWIGVLEYRVRQLEQHETYYHGERSKG